MFASDAVLLFMRQGRDCFGGVLIKICSLYYFLWRNSFLFDG